MSMRFDTPNCPECGELADGTLETLSGKAEMYEEAGTFVYDGGTKIFWDGQNTVTDGEGRVTLLCHSGHDWLSVVTYVEEDRDGVSTMPEVSDGLTVPRLDG